MKLINCTTTAPNRRKLEIAIDAAAFAAACEAAYKKNASKINVPGFRKGKVPRNVVERMFGKEFFFEDAVNALYPEALDAAIKEAGLDYVDDAIDLDVSTISLEEGVVFTAEITVKPEVKLPKYEGIEVERPVVNVTDEQIDERIRQLRERNSRVIDVDDRPAKEGDTCVFDFDGYVDGEPFEGGKADGFELVLGSGNFIPGFEAQMVGHSVGEEFEVNVTFPEEYHAKELAGKPAVFKIKLHNIKETQLPELDDDFVTEVSEDCDTVEQLRDSIRKELTETAEKKAENTVVDRIYDWVIDEMECDLPEAMVENRITNTLRDFDVRLRGQGITLEQYCQYLGTNMAQMREQSRANAERQVRVRLALEYVAKAAGIAVTDEEVDVEVAKMAEQHKMTVEAVRAAINYEDLREDIAVGRAADLVREKAIVTDEKAE